MTYLHGGEKGIYDKKIKYDFSVNINPLGPPESVTEALSTLNEEIVNYPNQSDYESLKKRLAFEEVKAVYGTDFDTSRLLLGNGASELIHALTLMLSPDKALIISPCFYGYERALEASGAKIFYADIYNVTELLDKHKPEAVCLCNPSNPKGELISKDTLSKIADKCAKIKCQLFIDECFLGFIADERDYSTLSLMIDNPYITVIRAFTKLYAIPGVRLGYAYISKELDRYNPKAYIAEWNVSSIALRLGNAALDAGDEYRKRTIKLLKSERAYLTDDLRTLGFTDISGEANFLYFKCENEIFYELINAGILIRRCDNYKGIDDDCHYRIAIKKREENEILIRQLNRIIKVG